MSFKTVAFRLLLAAVLIVTGAVGWTMFRLWQSWNDVEVVSFGVSRARAITDALPEDVNEPGGEPPPDLVDEPEQVDDDVYDAFLIVGNEKQFGGSRADVILFVLLPRNGDDPAMVSLPRDLYVKSPCSKKFNRINVNLNGCGDEVSGPELLALAVEDFTGIEVDHFALFDFDGFQQVIDRVGGVRICVDHPTADTNVGLGYWRLPAGCSTVDGRDALGWVRSRHTIQLVDGEWRSMRGVSDLTRNQRQQEILLQMLSKVRSFKSVGRLLGTIEGLADAFTIDDDLSLRDAANLAWDARALDPNAIHRLKVPVRNHVTDSGAQVLVPTASFTDVLAEAYPDLVAAAAGDVVD